MKTETFSTDETGRLAIDPFHYVAFVRSVNCQLLVNNDVCYACKTYSQSHFQDQSIKSKRLHEPAKLKTPISKTAPPPPSPPFPPTAIAFEMQATAAIIE